MITRAGPAFLQFDWSKADLSMDLPVFIYSHRRQASNFLQDREDIGQVTFFLLQIMQREPCRILVLSTLKSVKVY